METNSFGEDKKIRKVYIRFESMTYAIKAQRKIKSEGIYTEIIKSTEENGGGCSYGLSVLYEDYMAVVRILRENGISFSQYSKRP